ncbi:MAG: O-Antigen ligase [Actinomycetota bacterium]|nr:O-Antigen ligase [Actinomycetota bacterium]
MAGALSYAVFVRGTRKRVLGGLTVGAMALVFFFAPGAFAQDFRLYLSESTQQSNAASGNVVGRQQLLAAGIDAVVRNPLAGSGVGSTFKGDSVIVTSDGQAFSDIANFPLDVAIETGATGLLALIMIIVTSLRRASKFQPTVRRTLVAATVGVFVSSLGVTALSVAGIALFVLGLYAAEPETRSSEPVHTAHALGDRSSRIEHEAAVGNQLLEIHGRVRRKDHHRV